MNNTSCPPNPELRHDILFDVRGGMIIRFQILGRHLSTDGDGMARLMEALSALGWDWVAKVPPSRGLGYWVLMEKRRVPMGD